MTSKLLTPDLIDEVMTPCPETVAMTASVETARDLMKQNGFRHLPVMDHNELRGIVSHRDLQFALGWSGKSGVELSMADVCIHEPFTVTTGTLLSHVLKDMAENKIGSALVLDEKGELVGIFTSSDAVDILSELLT